MNNFLNAAESHFKALMDEHALTLNLYMTSSVGIGEHPNVFEEFINAVQKYEAAQSNFNVIQEMKSQPSASTGTGREGSHNIYINPSPGMGAVGQAPQHLNG